MNQNLKNEDNMVVCGFLEIPFLISCQAGIIVNV